ncbi:MAG TPA: GNAT family N-acetyltransferase [Phycisphaerae bacterium]|jgi:GNAT superfamily N-acetyltransferase|nr:GNAT family N-acetyltransferase [Phycisphaerae bacterium]
MSKFQVRAATLEDVDALVTLRARFLAEISSADPSSPELLLALRRYFQTAIPAGEFFGAVGLVGAQTVAAGGLVFHTHPPTSKNLAGREAYIMNMYTLPEFRRRGVGAAVLRKLVEHAHTSGYIRVTLHALPEGRSIYEECGFQPTEGEMRFDLRKLRMRGPRKDPGEAP